MSPESGVQFWAHAFETYDELSELSPSGFAELRIFWVWVSKISGRTSGVRAEGLKVLRPWASGVDVFRDLRKALNYIV